MKQLATLPLGSAATGSLAVNGGELVVGVAGKLGKVSVDAKVGYPVADILAPVKTAIIDKIKAAIPIAIVDDAIEKAWDEGVALLSEAPAQPAAPAPAAG